VSAPAGPPDPAPSGRRIDPLGGVSVAAASLLFGAVVIIGKVATDEGYPVTSFLALRFGVAAALIAVVLAVTRRPLRAAPGEGSRLLALGVFGYGLESMLFFLGLRHGGPAAVTLLFFTYPVWVTVWSVATGRGRPGGLVLMSLAAAVMGAALVVLGSGGLEITVAGILFALAAALVFAAYLTGAGVVLVRTNSLTGSMWVSAAASAALTAVAVGTGHAQWPATDHQWLSAIAVGACTAGAFVFLFTGLRRLGAVRTSIIAASEPLCAAILSVLVLDERLSTATIVGGALILAAAVVAALAREDRPPEARGRPADAQPDSGIGEAPLP
jgi:drug/metabolite transporter (DMT)-like permease